MCACAIVHVCGSKDSLWYLSCPLWVPGIEFRQSDFSAGALLNNPSQQPHRLFYYFKAGSSSFAQMGLELVILLPQSPEKLG